MDAMEVKEGEGYDPILTMGSKFGLSENHLAWCLTQCYAFLKLLLYSVVGDPQGA
jgi:hypothetical protein